MTGPVTARDEAAETAYRRWLTKGVTFYSIAVELGCTRRVAWDLVDRGRELALRALQESGATP